MPLCRLLRLLRTLLGMNFTFFLPNAILHLFFYSAFVGSLSYCHLSSWGILRVTIIAPRWSFAARAPLLHLSPSVNGGAVLPVLSAAFPNGGTWASILIRLPLLSSPLTSAPAFSVESPADAIDPVSFLSRSICSVAGSFPVAKVSVFISHLIFASTSSLIFLPLEPKFSIGIDITNGLLTWKKLPRRNWFKFPCRGVCVAMSQRFRQH